MLLMLLLLLLMLMLSSVVWRVRGGAGGILLSSRNNRMQFSLALLAVSACALGWAEISNESGLQVMYGSMISGVWTGCGPCCVCEV